MRESIASFLADRGIEVIRSEDVNFSDGTQIHPHDVCLSKINEANEFLLIIDREAGDNYKGSEAEYQGLTITHAELRRALKEPKIKVHCFISIEVLNYYKCWDLNGKADGFQTGRIDKKIFEVLDFITDSGKIYRNTFLHVEDLKEKIKQRFEL